MSIDPDQLLELATRYGVPILKALAILIVGWGAAKVLSLGVGKLLTKTEWDDRLASYLTKGKAKELPIEQGITRLVFWLIMLFVLMAVFQSLGLTIITEPLNALVTKITAFLPQLLAAAALVLIAWVVASVLRVVLENLLTAFELDEKIGESAGEEEPKVSLAKTLADAVYYLVFLLFLPQILDALQMEGLSPVRDMVGQILGFLPSLLGAALVFFIFYVVARIMQHLATNLLTSVGFDRLPGQLGFEPAGEEAPSASTVAGYAVLAALVAVGLVQALTTLQLAIVSELANELLQGFFNILVAGAIFAVGLLLSQLSYRALSGRSATLAFVTRAAILIFAGAMALHKTNLAPEIVNLAFGAFIVGLALAGGLAFGLGGREAAAKMIEGWRSEEES